MTDARVALTGLNVLLVEDDYFVMKRLRDALGAAGATVLGPASGLPKALALARGAERIDAAVLDVNLHGENVFPVADALAARGVPFVFATGYDESTIPARHAEVELHQKPVDPDAIVRSLFARHPGS